MEMTGEIIKLCLECATRLRQTMKMEITERPKGEWAGKCAACGKKRMIDHYQKREEMK